MKKNLKTIIFSLIGLLILSVTILVLQLTQPDNNSLNDNPDQTTEYIPLVTVITDYTAQDIISIHIINKNDSGYTIIPDSQPDSWKIGEISRKVTYNQAGFLNLAANAAQLSTSSTAQENVKPEELEKYGLSQSAMTVIVKFKPDSEVTFLIGGDVPGRAEFYFKKDDNSTVYTISSHLIMPFLNSRHDWIDKTAFPPYNPETAVERLTVERLGWDKPMIIEPLPEYEFEEATTFNTHKFTSPVNIELDQEKTRDILYGIFGLTAYSVAAVDADDEFLETAGIKTPSCTVTAEFGGEAYTLTIGNPAQSADGITVGWFGTSSQVPGVLFLFEPNPVLLPWLYTEPEDLVSQMFMMPYIYSLDELIIEFSPENQEESQTKILNFKITGDTEENTITLDGIKLSQIESDLFTQLYQYLILAKGESLFFEQEHKGETIAKITYIYRDESRPDNTVEFLTADDRKSVIRVNGENLYKCRDVYTTRLIKNIQAFIDGGEIVLNW